MSTDNNQFSLDNIESLQALNKVSLSGIVGAMVLLALSLLPVFGYQDSAFEHRVLGKTESIAYQVLEIQSKGQVRGIASSDETGQMGSDPWGNPYLYRFENKGDSKIVVVWSKGPNGVNDSAEGLADQSLFSINPQFKADDLGTVLKL